MLTLLQYNNSIITVNEIDSYYTREYSFDLDIDKDLQVAFGITYYDDNSERLDFDDIGQIVPRIKSWKTNQGTTFSDVNFWPCTEEELGIDEKYSEQDARFYPPHPNSIGFMKFYRKKLNCIEDDIEIYGNYESDEASHLQIQFERCNPEKRSCKTEEEITNAMNRLFIVTVHNSIRFD